MMNFVARARQRTQGRSGKSLTTTVGTSDAGFTMIELSISLVILAVGIFGVVSSLAFSAKQVALGRQRQTAVEAAAGRLEHLRNVPYTDLGTDVMPVHDADPLNPDYDVNGVQYDVNGAAAGGLENLISTPAGVLHLENPVTIGETIVEIYQYVTWADSSVAGANALKRVTVVVKFKSTTVGGVERTIHESSLYSPGTVSQVTTTTLVPTTTTTLATTTTTLATTTTTLATTTTTSVGPTTTTIPTTTTTSAGACPGDMTGPTGSFSLPVPSGGAVGYSPTRTINITVSLTDTCLPIVYNLSNDGTTYDVDIAYLTNHNVSWSLTTGDGTKTVWVRTRDNASNSTVFTQQTIVLDTTIPTAPATFTKTVNCDTQTFRIVNLSWGVATDINLLGYRIYRSVNNGTYTALTTTPTSTRTFQDTTGRRDDSVRYYVVGYDKAGNQSNASPTIALPKC